MFGSAWRGRKGWSGPGDDCARLVPPRGRALLWTTDQVALGVHARRDATPEQLARKLLRRCLSDLAAAGAQPWAATWTLAAPPRTPFPFLTRLARAFLREARAFDLPVVGGDVSGAGALVLTASLLGLEARGGTPGRGGARAGDLLCVTGALGAAVSSGRHLRPVPRLAEGRRLAERYRVHAMMDLSDGLARDLPRLLTRSGVGAEVELDALPRARGTPAGARGIASMVGEGEDYELLAALAPQQAARALKDPLLRRCGFTVIGRVRAGRGLRCRLDGRRVSLPVAGWEHAWGKARS
jgi:thiamine-monophosphate kinase